MADDVPKLPHEDDTEFYEIPPDIWDVRLTRNRHFMQTKYAYTLPTQDALNTIMKYKGEEGGFLEVGAGRGYWAMLLRDMGGDIIATDLDKDWFEDADRYTNIVELGAVQATVEYPNRTLIIMYPPNNSTWPIDAISMYQGKYIILVVGDGCATDELWVILDEKWDEVETISLTHWPLFPSCMTVYERKPQSNLETEILSNIHNRVLRLELHTKRHAPTLDR